VHCLELFLAPDYQDAGPKAPMGEDILVLNEYVSKTQMGF